MVTIGFISILTGLLGGWLSTSGNDYLSLMLGALSTAFVVVINYNLGSTIESGRKTDIIANSMPIDRIKDVQKPETTVIEDRRNVPKSANGAHPPA